MIVNSSIKIGKDFDFLEWLMCAQKHLYDIAKKNDEFVEFLDIQVNIPPGVLGLSGKYRDMNYTVGFYSEGLSPLNICRIESHYKVLDRQTFPGISAGRARDC